MPKLKISRLGTYLNKEEISCCDGENVNDAERKIQKQLSLD